MIALTVTDCDLNDTGQEWASQRGVVLTATLTHDRASVYVLNGSEVEWSGAYRVPLDVATDWYRAVADHLATVTT